jgi:hypothetical protein
MSKETRKRKNAVKAVEKAAKKALKRGATGREVGVAAERGIIRGKRKAASPDGKSKKPVRKGPRSGV